MSENDRGWAEFLQGITEQEKPIWKKLVAAFTDAYRLGMKDAQPTDRLSILVSNARIHAQNRLSEERYKQWEKGNK